MKFFSKAKLPLLFTLTLVAAFIFSACSATGDPLEFLHAAAAYRGMLEINGASFDVTLEYTPDAADEDGGDMSGTAVITVHSPATLEGMSITVGADIHTTVNGVSIPMIAASMHSLYSFCGAFSVCGGDIADVSTSDGGSVFVCRTDHGSYEITLDAAGQPSRITNGEYTLTVAEYTPAW